MRISSFFYLAKEGVKSVWKNRLMSAASIGVLVACMLLIGSSLIVSMNINKLVGSVEEQNEMVVFVRDGVTRSQISRLDKDLRAIENIISVEFVSREEALERQKELLGEAGQLLEGLEKDNPLPDSYIVKVDDLSLLQATIDEISRLGGVDKINAPTDVADALSSLKRIVQVAGISIVVILAAVSLIIIANTIKITVFNRRKEITIMKYVGATDGFIKMPFVIEGFVLGTVSAVMAFGILWAGYDYILNWLAQSGSAWLLSAQTTAIPFKELAHTMFIRFIAGGTAIGVFGSLVFVRKHLKV